MKPLASLFLFFIFFLTVQSCEKENVVVNGLEGTWNILTTSGGIHGGGTTPIFDQIKFDSDSNFELLDMGAVLVKGHLEEIDHQHFELYVRLVPDEILTNESIGLLLDNEKAIILDGNELSLNSDCCDRFNYHFERD